MGLLLDAWRSVAPDGAQKLTLVHIGGQIETLDTPMLPYFYMMGDHDEVAGRLAELRLKGVVSITEEICAALSDLDAAPAPWCRVEVRNVNVVSDLNRILEYEPTARDRRLGTTTRPVVAENHLAFTERVGADLPEWYGSTTQKTAADLTFLWLDIEQSSRPQRFPDEDDPIISIAWEAEGPNVPAELREGIVVLEDTDLATEKRMPGMGTVRLWDHRILKEFARVFSLINPDAIIGFNLHDYDLRMIAGRGRRVGIGATWMCRKGSPRFTTEKVGMWEKIRAELGGRLVFDVFERVQIDQSLNGKVKDRGLKTVAAYRGLHVEKINTRDALGEWRGNRERFISYNKNDVRITRILGDPYWQNAIAYAEMTKAPLRFVVDGTANYFGTRFSAEDFRVKPAPFLNGARVLSDGTNHRRYSHLYSHKPDDAAFVTGAKVGIHKTGVFTKGIWKVDVGGLYPSIIETLGLSPDNTIHMGLRDDGQVFSTRYVEGSPARGIEGYREYSLPDEEWGCNHIIRVYGRGSLSVRIKRNKEIRKEVKKKMKVIEKRLGKDKAEDDSEWKLLDGQQQMLKQANNSVYGNNANEYARYGSFAVGMMITGIGRVILSQLEAQLGDIKVESDTDGIYCDSTIDVGQTNELITDFVKTRCLIDENTIQVELDEYTQGFFHSMKNYVLLGKDGKITRHGSAIVGAKHCALWDQAVEKAVSEIFGLIPTGTYAAWKLETEQALRSSRIEIERLVQRQAVKASGEYATNTQGRQIALSHLQVFGREPHPDSKVEFIHTRSGFEVSVADGVERRIDAAHYASLLKDVETMFGLGKKFKPLKLSDFLTAGESS